MSLSANPTEGLRLPEKKIRKQLTPLYDVYGMSHYYQTKGRTSLPFQSFCGKLSKFTSWKKLNASYVMSATDFPPRCKDKKNLANDVHVSRIFCKNSSFFLNLATSYRFFHHLSSLFVHNTLIFSASDCKCTKQT